MSQGEYVCGKCGSADVETKEWRKVNTGKFVDSVSSYDDMHNNMCPDCQDYTKVITHEEYIELHDNPEKL